MEAKKLVFVSGFLIFAISNFLLNYIPLVGRAAPVEVDDAYTLIQQSPQMETCFLQDCPALNDLRAQLTIETTDPVIAAAREREYKSTFLIWHPLYSLLFSGVHGLGLSWESAYNVVILLGSLLLSVGAAIWLLLLFDYGAAGVALLLLSLHAFQGPGLNLMFPKTMALFVALILWSLMIKSPRISPWFFPLAGLIMVTLHPMGQFYLLISLGIYATRHFLNYKQFPRKDWLALTVAVFISIVPLLLPLVIERPELSSISAGQTADELSLVDGLIANVRASYDVLRTWAASFWPFSGGALVLIPFTILGVACSYGFAKLGQQRRILTGLWGGFLVAFAVLSSLYHLSGFPGYLFENVWPLLAAMLGGLLGHATFSWLEDYWRTLNQAKPNRGAKRLMFFKQTRQTIVLEGIFVLLIALLSLVEYVSYNWRNYLYTIEYRETKGQVILGTQQPELLLRDSDSEEDDVLYMDETLMHFFFTHGALDRGAVYYPGLEGSPEEKTFIENNENLEYIVAWNPIRTLAHDFWPWEAEVSIEEDGMLRLVPGKPVFVESTSPVDLSSLSLLLEGAEEAILRVSIPTQGEVFEFEFSPDLGWYQLTEAGNILANAFSIEVAGATEGVRLAGIRVGGPAGLRWPWDQGISLRYDYSSDDQGAISVSFASSELFPDEARSVEVLDDSGSSVLARIVD